MKSKLFRTSPGSLLLLAMPAGLIAQAQGPKPASYTIIDVGTLGGRNSFAYSNNHADS
jgi:hypothetical protein